MAHITVHLPVGAVAAILTAFEFVLTLLLGLSIRAVFHAQRLIKLHSRRHLTISGRSRTLRAHMRGLVSTVLAAWLVVTVAVVESNLGSGIFISTVSTNDASRCIRTDRTLHPAFLTRFTPALRVVFEGWTLAVTQSLRTCDALATLGSGGGGLQPELAGGPQCNRAITIANDSSSSTATSDHVVQAAITQYTVTNTPSGPKLQLIPTETDLFELLSYNASVARTPVANGTQCNSRGISNYFATVDERAAWFGLHTDSDRVAYAVAEALCEAHGTDPVVPLGNADAAECTQRMGGDERKGTSTVIDVSCTRRKATENAGDGYLHTVVLEDVGAFFATGRTSADGRGYVCVGARVQVEYLFFPGLTISRETEAEARPSLLVTGVSALQGSHCEPSPSVIGRAALVYAHDAEWRRTELLTTLRQTQRSDKMDQLRLQMFHGFSVAVSSAQLPLADVDSPEQEDAVQTCQLMAVSAVTYIHQDAAFALFVTGVIVGAIFIVVALACRLFYSSDTWTVGSKEWTLAKLTERAFSPKGLCSAMAADDTDDYDDKALIVVVESPGKTRQQFVGPDPSFDEVLEDPIREEEDESRDTNRRRWRVDQFNYKLVVGSSNIDKSDN